MLVEWRSLLGDLSEDATQVNTAGRRVLERMGQLGGPWRMGAADAVPEPTLSEAMSHFASADLTMAVNDAELMGRARTKRFLATIYLMELEALAEHAESVLALVESERR
jgi:predicted nuclease with TOPRIM domain